MWRLRTFGGLAIENGRIEAAAATRRRPLALLALLAVAGTRGMRREKVVSLLWPESDEERGRNSLSQALAALRRDMAEDDVVVGTVELQLNPSLMTSDVAEFEGALASSDLERAVALYQGPFLDGFFVKDSAEFERWSDEQRRRLHQMYFGAIQRLARQADERHETQAAVTWWRRLASLEPTNAAAALGLMEALAAAGDRAGALQHYRVHQELLRQDVGVEPEPDVQRFVAGLRTDIRVPLGPLASKPDELRAAESRARDVPAPLPIASRRWASWPIPAAAAGIAVVAMIALSQNEARPPVNPRRVVVTEFNNRTGDSTLDVFGMLAADFISDALQRTDVVDVADPATVLTMTGDRDRAKRIDEAAMVKHLGTVSRARFVVSGHFSRDGDSLVIVARIADAVHGRAIGATEPFKTSPDAPRDALESVSQRVLGILATRIDDQLRDVLTPGSTPPPTLAAYREHVAGLLAYQRQEETVARTHFQRAQALDSTFVAPLIWEAFALGIPPFNPVTAPDRRRVIQQLARRRADLTSLDRHLLDYLEAQDRSDVEGQIAAIRQASDLAPGSFWTYWLASSLGGALRFEESIETLEQIDRAYGWTHKWPQFWQTLVEGLSRVDHQRELEIAREARHALPALMNPLYLEARALGSLRRWGEFRHVIEEMRTFPDERHQLGNLLNVLGMVLWTRQAFAEGHQSFQGDTLLAMQLVDEAIAWFRALPPDVAERSGIRREFATALMNANRCDEARPMLERLVAEEPREFRAHQILGVCFARLGERGRAEAVIDGLLASADSASWNYMWAAGIAASLGDQERAVRFLRELKNRGHRVIIRRLVFKYFDGMAGYAPFLAITEPQK